jgi:hypothetical protein
MDTSNHGVNCAALNDIYIYIYIYITEISRQVGVNRTAEIERDMSFVGSTFSIHKSEKTMKEALNWDPTSLSC